MTSSDRRSFLKGAAGAAAAFAFQPDLSATPRSLSAPLRVGLIGAGRQGRKIMGELGKFEDVTLAAVCDSDARRLSGAKRRAPQATLYSEHKAMLESAGQLDAVFIATPTHQHRSLCEDALDAGKHVYCEAPLAHTLEDAKAIARAARAASGKFQTGMAGRSNPVYSLARSFVRTGAIRDTLSLRSQFKKKTSWRTPTSDPARDKFLNWRLDPSISLGLVGEVGTHHFDTLHWFTGQYPTSVRGTGEILAWKDGREVADTVHCEFQFPGGVRSQWEASLGTSFEGEYSLLAGTMGTVKLAGTHAWMFKEADATTFEWEVYATRQQFHQDEGIILIAGATELAAQGKLKEGIGLPHPPLYYAMENFLVAVGEDSEPCCSAEEGLRAAAVAIRAAEAIRTGTEVAIPEKDFSLE